jgi:hypothetical protein
VSTWESLRATPLLSTARYSWPCRERCSGASGSSRLRAEKLRLDAYTSYLKPVLPLVDGWVIDTAKRIEDRRLARDDATLATVDSHYGALRHLLELCVRDIGSSPLCTDRFDVCSRVALAKRAWRCTHEPFEGTAE